MDTENTPTAVTPNPTSDSPMPASAVTPTPRQKGRGYWRWYLGAAALALAVAAGALAAVNNDDSTAPAAMPTVTSTTFASDVAPAVADIADSTTTFNPSYPVALDARQVGETVIPSVVTVQIRGATFTGEEAAVGSGSGVVYDDQGHIITNDHVATAGSSYEVVLSDGRIYPAEVVGTDPSTDLAVLQITAADLQPIEVGSTATLTVGDPAVAVGSPLGLDGGPSLTVGVLSAFDRLVQTDAVTVLYGMLQTDAPITSGSSGGALVNASGELIGITTAVGVSSVGVEGIGFATPIEIVTRVADELIASGDATQPYLGVSIQVAMEDTADGGSTPIGIGLQEVVAGLAAADAGLEVGDVITKLNGVDVRSNSDLIGQLRRYAAGMTIEVSLADGRLVDVTLGQRPDDL